MSMLDDRDICEVIEIEDSAFDEFYQANHYCLERPFSPAAPLTPQRYQGLLERLYEKLWFKTPCPGNPREKSIWSMRTALIDCFVYSGGGPS